MSDPSYRRKSSHETCLAHLYQWLWMSSKPAMNIDVADSHDILFQVGSIRYVACNANGVDIQPAFSRPPPSTLLVTVIQCNETLPIGRNWLENYLKNADKHDDVFCPAFIQGLIFITGNNSSAPTRTQFTQQTRTYLDEIGNQWLQICSRHELPKGMSPGVYYLSGMKLKRVFRLYDDVNKSFLTTLEPRSRAK